tara:strand:- start:3008 stop:4939 length:1932 start_codon:yes stop_codon:yes gene_type:complete
MRVSHITATFLSAFALAAVGTLVAGPTNGHALELFGKCLFGACKTADSADSELIDPKQYTAELTILPEEDKDIAKAVRAASELVRGSDAAVGGSAGLIARAKGDYRRIQAALYNEAHYGGSISIEINGRQAADIPAGTQIPDVSTVDIVVRPGNLFRIRDSIVMNPAPPTSDPKDKVDRPEDRGFAEGEPARAGVVRRAGDLSREAWRQQGYPKARVEKQIVTAVHAEDYLRVYLWMAQGPYAVYGDIDVEGVERMSPEFVLYMSGLIKGEEFDPDDLEKARKRLERLGVFALQKIEEAPEVLADGSLPLTIITSEKKPRRIGVGATLSTIDGAGVEAYWLHRNLFGQAERLRLDGRIAGLGSTIDYTQFDYLLGAEFTKPGVFNPDTDLTLGTTAKREVNDTYTETSVSATATLKHYYSDELTFTGGLFAEFGEYTDTFGTRQLFTTGILTQATFDQRDNKLEPTSGFYADLKARPFYEWEFESAGLHLEAEGRAYVAVGSKNAVLAGRLKLGSMAGIAVQEAPPDLLFFAGGGGSVRGYGYKNIGVTEPDGSISGGRSLLEASVELRQRITGNFGAVAFLDIGTVGPDSAIDFSEDLKIGVGAGLRYYTGLGAIRLDVGVPLDPGKDDPAFGIYVGIGQAF